MLTKLFTQRRKIYYDEATETQRKRRKNFNASVATIFCVLCGLVGNITIHVG